MNKIILFYLNCGKISNKALHLNQHLSKFEYLNGESKKRKISYLSIVYTSSFESFIIGSFAAFSLLTIHVSIYFFAFIRSSLSAFILLLKTIVVDFLKGLLEGFLGLWLIVVCILKAPHFFGIFLFFVKLFFIFYVFLFLVLISIRSEFLLFLVLKFLFLVLSLIH